MVINIPAGVGELVDKLTILAIKKQKIADPAKLHNVTVEYEELAKVYTVLYNCLSDLDGTTPSGKVIAGNLMARLCSINETIWGIEDDIRDHEKRQDFGPSFVQLARGVYHNNDERARVKKEINQLFGSTIIEEKSYIEYK